MSGPAVDWRERARELRAADPRRTYASIAEEFGVTTAAAWKAIHPERAREFQRRYDAEPERAAAKRAWERDHDRGVCEVCGGPTSLGGHDGRAARRCQQHEMEARRAGRLARAGVIERMWAEGASRQDIADALGTSANSVGVAISELRREGLADLPYRHRGPWAAR